MSCHGRAPVNEAMNAALRSGFSPVAVSRARCSGVSRANRASLAVPSNSGWICRSRRRQAPRRCASNRDGSQSPDTIASASRSASRRAWVMPWAVTGCITAPASPASTQPGPC